jgi:hypothetical protein
MVNTVHGIPYPTAADDTDIPGDIRLLAEAFDRHLPVLVRPTLPETHPLPVGQGNADPELFIDLSPGTYRVECVTTYLVSDITADVTQSWIDTPSGSITLGSRFVLGPQLGLVNTAAVALVDRPLAALSTAQDYGAMPTSSNYIRESLMVTTTAGGRLSLFFNVLRPAETLHTVTRGVASYLIARREEAR